MGRTKGAKRVEAVDVTGLPWSPWSCWFWWTGGHRGRRSHPRPRPRVRGPPGLAKSFTSATGWLQVACIATTLRHLSRERARRQPVALAA